MVSHLFVYKGDFMFNGKLKIKMTKRTILIIAICILLILALVLGLIFGIKGCSNSSTSSSEEPTSSETSSGTSSETSSSESSTSSDSTSADSSSTPGHTHTAGTPVKENEVAATCTVGGSYDLVTYCTTCEEKLNTEHKTTDPLGHNLVHHAVQAATCTDYGWNAYDTCSRCDYTTYEKINALGHDYDDSIAANVTYSWLDYATGSLQKSVKCSRDTAHDAQVSNVNSHLTVHTNDSDKGIVAVTAGYGLTVGESITVAATPASGYNFKGWYSDSGLTTKVSSSNPYTFSMPSGSYTLYAKFGSPVPGENPVVSGDTITFGMYPQTQVNSTLESTLDSAKAGGTITPDSKNNWYLYNDDFYAEAGSNWYKCEPITWKILNSSTASTDGYYYVVSQKILDQSIYQIFSAENKNNYKNSVLRAYLNGTFYNSAFAYADESVINTMNVDNSAATTKSDTNPYAPSDNSQDTSDKVTLLSYKEMNETYYSNDDARRATGTDYAIAKGVYQSGGYVHYWTRSPDHVGVHYGMEVGVTGVLGGNSVASNDEGIRPVIKITISG